MPWIGKQAIGNAVNVSGGIVGLPAAYHIVSTQEWMCSQSMDQPLLYLLGLFALPVAVSLILGVWIRSLRPGQAWAFVAWLERCWIAQLLLLCCWAAVLRQRQVLDPDDAPWATRFGLAYWGSFLVVAIITTSLMVRFRGKKPGGIIADIVVAQALFAAFTAVLWLLDVPNPISHWWCPRV